MNQLLLYYQRKNHIEDDMIYKNAAIEQEIFIRDAVCRNLLHNNAFVISLHHSKSITLPVYGFVMENGIKIICRNNFYDWKVSVELPQPIGKINAIPEDLIDSVGVNISSCYCEGFNEKWVYPAYNPNDTSLQKFTVEIDSKYEFYTFMYFLKHLFPNVNFYENKKWEKEEIASIIDLVNEMQGNKDMYDRKKELGLETSCIRPQMGGWEIWWRTYYAIDKKVKYITDEKGFSHRNIDFDMDTPENGEKFAEFIINDEEALKKFNFEFHQFREFNMT